MTADIWKPVPGYEGLYEVSVFGEVASSQRCRRGSSRLLRPRLVCGRPSVNLSKKRASLQFRVAVLVLLAFIGPPPDGARARHRDGDRGNCCLDNLEWCYEGGEDRMEGTLILYVVYERPKDYPEEIVCRRWFIDGAGPERPDAELYLRERELEYMAIRLQARGLTQIAGQDASDPCIVGVWV